MTTPTPPTHPAAPSPDGERDAPSGAHAATVQGRPAGMPDVQAQGDTRQVPIDKVGVKNVVYPITLRTPDGGAQTTVATINMYVSLPHHQKGTHMSRFLEVLNEHSTNLTPDKIVAVTREIRRRLNAADAHLEMEFTYFINKLAPVTKQPGLMDYQVAFACHSNSHDDFIMGVKAPATSLCPCSKEISRFGAHNQRCMISARVRFNESMWIEDLVRLLESAASSEVYAVLKRPDEKQVTEDAYENPKFVEDIVRDLAVALDDEARVNWYSIESENFESIHSHNAYAQVTRDKRAEQ